MKKTAFLLLILFDAAFCVQAQNYKTDTIAQEKALKLNFLVGEWKGSGWIIGQDMIKRTFDQTETVQFKLDSTALLIEGKGQSNEKIVQEALAIITYKGESNQYDFQSFLPSGQKGLYKSELTEGALYWYPTNFIRYTIRVNEQGQWYEIGEINKIGNWYPFFEMTLDKVP